VDDKETNFLWDLHRAKVDQSPIKKKSIMRKGAEMSCARRLNIKPTKQEWVLNLVYFSV
jgi:hypothetical protein